MGRCQPSVGTGRTLRRPPGRSGTANAAVERCQRSIGTGRTLRRPPGRAADPAASGLGQEGDGLGIIGYIFVGFAAFGGAGTDAAGRVVWQGQVDGEGRCASGGAAAAATGISISACTGARQGCATDARQGCAAGALQDRHGPSRRTGEGAQEGGRSGTAAGWHDPEGATAAARHPARRLPSRGASSEFFAIVILGCALSVGIFSGLVCGVDHIDVDHDVEGSAREVIRVVVERLAPRERGEGHGCAGCRRTAPAPLLPLRR